MGLCVRTIYLVGTLTSATNIGLIYAACPLFILSLRAHIFCSPIFRVQMIALFVSVVEVLVIMMKSGLLVLKTLEFNGGNLLVVMRTLAFFFYPVGRKTVDTCLPLFFC